MTELHSLPQRILACLKAHGPLDSRKLRVQLEVEPKNLGPALKRLRDLGKITLGDPPHGMKRGGIYRLSTAGADAAGKPANVATRPTRKDSPPAVIQPETPRPRFAIDDGTNVAINSGTNSVVLAKGDALRLHQFLEQMSPLLEQEEDDA